MRQDLVRRLDRLDRTLPRGRTGAGLDPVSKLVMCAVAFHFGGLQANEAIIDGFGRALGYSANDIREALRSGGLEFQARHLVAATRLFERFAFNPNNCTHGELLEFLDQLMRSLPQELLARLNLSGRSGVLPAFN